MKKRKKKKENIEFNSTQFIYVLTALVFIVGLVLLTWFAWGYFFNSSVWDEEDQKAKIAEVEDCKHRRILDGVCVEMESQVNPKLVAVMIENHLYARPQSGLVEASIVYEAPVEANYSRFLVIYPEDIDLDEVGPVRSARPYYLDWLSEYGDAQYMHVGGSPVALGLIDKYEINDLNEFYRGWYYWRASRRSAPHNVYTSGELWGKALEKYEENYFEKNYEGWKFDTISPEYENVKTSEQVSEITISFLPPVYEAVWKYNTSTHQYERYQMDEQHVDYDGEQIMADNIIVQYVESQVLDNVGRISIETIGQGEAVVFKNGRAIEAEWKKEARKSRTRFYDLTGEEIKFKPGKIWIEVMNGRGGVEY